jgi:glycosyltransferase involved in cell wall biosynthesis
VTELEPSAPPGAPGSRAADAGGPEPFSVVIPVFDEEQALRDTLDAVRATLAPLQGGCEIVVVDDGSTDATPAILAPYADLTVVRHERNRGYGAALKSGIAAARHPLIVVMDADGTYPVAAIPQLAARCAGADMVVGARTGREVHSTPARAAVKWCFRQFAQWITGAAIPDLNSGLRVFRRAVSERFLPLLPDGFSFTTTITVASLAERLVVHFEPVDYKARIGSSKIRPLRDTLRIARQLARLGVRLAPRRTAAAIAMALGAVGAGLAAAHWRSAGGVGPIALVSWLAGGAVYALGVRAERRRGAARLLPLREPLG